MQIKINEIVEIKYFTKPFKNLLTSHPELKPFIISNNPPKFDLGDPNFLSELNRCLFLDITRLHIQVPSGYLIPSFGLRYAYCDIIMREVEIEKE